MVAIVLDVLREDVCVRHAGDRNARTVGRLAAFKVVKRPAHHVKSETVREISVGQPADELSFVGTIGREEQTFRRREGEVGAKTAILGVTRLDDARIVVVIGGYEVGERVTAAAHA